MELTCKSDLTLLELVEIAEYTVHKINSFPKEWGKTFENYFDALYPDEIKNYLTRDMVNRGSEKDRSGNYGRAKDNGILNRVENIWGDVETGIDSIEKAVA